MSRQSNWSTPETLACKEEERLPNVSKRRTGRLLHWELSMKITVEFLSLPNVVKMVGSKTILLDFSGKTVNDLVHEVAGKYGRDVQKFLLDESGQLDMSLGLTLNKQEWLRHNQMDRQLRDGDRITIMMLAAGG
jgi:molybdopterin converting factor small subunit